LRLHHHDCKGEQLWPEVLQVLLVKLLLKAVVIFVENEEVSVSENVVEVVFARTNFGRQLTEFNNLLHQQLVQCEGKSFLTLFHFVDDDAACFGSNHNASRVEVPEGSDLFLALVISHCVHAFGRSESFAPLY
jgi:hypothetical protein